MDSAVCGWVTRGPPQELAPRHPLSAPPRDGSIEWCARDGGADWRRAVRLMTAPHGMKHMLPQA